MSKGHWYCVANDGVATLCVDKDDAVETAAQADIDYPRLAPHKAAQLIPVECIDELRRKLFNQGWDAGYAARDEEHS